jgi:hypothetical protein
MEAEAREILQRGLEAGLLPSTASNLYEAIRAVVEPVGGIDIDITPRESVGVFRGPDHVSAAMRRGG